MALDRKWDGNPMYNPSSCGLVLIDSLDHADSYEFNTDVIFKDIETGALYYAHDSGCSCPTPFEDVNSLSCMEIITSRQRLTAVIKEVQSRHESEYSHSDKQEFNSFVKKLKDAFSQYEVEEEQKRIANLPKYKVPLSDVVRTVKKRNIL